MDSVRAYYRHEHGENPIILTLPDDVDALIDGVRSESVWETPILVSMYLADDPYSQMMMIGVLGERGLVRFANQEWPDGVVTTNGEPAAPEELIYFYQGHSQEFPPNSEISLDLVREAVKEFMATGGARPTCIEWQPGFT